MRKVFIILLLSLISYILFAQERRDTIKTGWNFGFLPAVAYDSDLGVYYGIIMNPFDYKDGSIYPNYYQQIYLQIAGYSKGSYEHSLKYETYSLFPKVKFTSELKFVGYKAYPFYGYNGNESIYHYEWEQQDDPSYKTTMYYRMERKYVRLITDFQDTIGKSKFQWHAGYSLANYRIAPVNEKDKPTEINALYEDYYDWDLIREAERSGGTNSTFLVGLIFDSRNQLTNPDKGIFTEFNISWMPSMLSSGGYNALSIGIIHKQYFGLIRHRLNFAYRLWWNSNIGGDQPFYTRQLLTTFDAKEGYGGTSTIRGALMQRIVSKDFFLGTFELRSRIFNYRFIDQNWYFGAIVFMDAGRIIKPFKQDLSKVPPESLPVYFGPADRSIHKSIGGGLKIAMNENFVLSAEYALPLDRQDGIYGLYLGLGYQF